MWFILTPILVILLTLAAWWLGETFLSEGFGPALFVGIFGSIAAIFLMFAVFPYAAGEHGTVRETGTETRDLQALNTDTALEGSMYRGIFLGRGVINEEQVITYVYQNADGGFQLDRSDAENSVIFEDEQDDPYLTITSYEMVPNGWFAPFSWYWTAQDSYEFHIPEGSVADNYVVAP